MPGVLRKRGDVHREDDHVMMKAKIGMMLPQTEECLGLTETRGSKESFSSREPKVTQSFQYLNFGLLASGRRENKFLLF